VSPSRASGIAVATDAGEIARDDVLGLERAAAIGVENFGDRFRHSIIDRAGCS
jgi:hypothetical protein